LLWGEAKQKATDVTLMLAQLVLTIGKARTFDDILPPPFLGCFDCEKIAFVPYDNFHEIFYQNDFNWKVAPSDHGTPEFKQVRAKVLDIIENKIPLETYVFDFFYEKRQLLQFINNNFLVAKSPRIRIDKNNFISIYNRWIETVRPTIDVDWGEERERNLFDGHFYLADLLSDQNKTLAEKLSVLLKTDQYEVSKKIPGHPRRLFERIGFKDGQKAHARFWAVYERPPPQVYWDYIIDRQDLLVPQDVRERKGSFYTPKIWVELSQEYIADALGENWQDEYVVWDCAAGTGNLLAGLTNKYNIWASTLDQADVDTMHERIRNGANLLEDHVFQFDFLNDDFSKLPEGLKKILNNPEKRKKLVVYINPPYAEAMNRRDTKNAKIDVNRSAVEKRYSHVIGKSARELFILFMTRVYMEIPCSTLALFSKLKYVSSPNFSMFREMFKAKCQKGFVVRADSFDNVKGCFPIAFTVWNLNFKASYSRVSCDVVENNRAITGIKRFYSHAKNTETINDWLKQFHCGKYDVEIAAMCCKGTDFQNSIFVNINHRDQLKGVGNSKGITKFGITAQNLIPSSIYFSVRKVIPATWLNDRDQFLYPKESWKNDLEFHNDCLAFTIFNTNVQSKYGTNHWIPFREYDVGAKNNFDSRFMFDFFMGNDTSYLRVEETPLLYMAGVGGGEDAVKFEKQTKHIFSLKACSVFKKAFILWKFYHSKCGNNPNASLYDIREHFQGRDEKGKMNLKSKDEEYNEMIGDLRASLKTLARNIEPKVYEHGFLRN